MRLNHLFQVTFSIKWRLFINICYSYAFLMKSIYFVVIIVSHLNWRAITKLINKRTFISMRFFAIFIYSVTRLNRILEFQAIWKEIIQSLRFIFHFQIQMGASFHFQSYVFLSGYWIVRDERVYCFRNFFLIYYIFLIQILVILFFSFFQEIHTFISLFYIELDIFFCFPS